MSVKMGFKGSKLPENRMIKKPEGWVSQTKIHHPGIYFGKLYASKEAEEKRLKGAFRKGTEKPPSIILDNASTYVKGRVVFSAKNAENLHPIPLTTLLSFSD
jgi:hypothetical protein